MTTDATAKPMTQEELAAAIREAQTYVANPMRDQDGVIRDTAQDFLARAILALQAERDEARRLLAEYLEGSDIRTAAAVLMSYAEATAQETK